MSYIEAKIASKADVLVAAKEGIKIQSHVDYSELEGGWRLEVLFQRGGQHHNYQGRLFRAPSRAVAYSTAKKRLDRILGAPREAGRKFSAAYVTARDALEKKIADVWVAAGKTELNVIVPGAIKFDWKSRQPKLKVLRFTSITLLEARYNPEFSIYRETSLTEAKHA